MARSRRRIRRARKRGVSTVSTVLECTMVMAWFVALILGERHVSNAADARRAAERKTEESASVATGAYCRSPGDGQVDATVLKTGKPNAERAIAAIAGLGLGRQSTFANYTRQLEDVRTSRTEAPDSHGITKDEHRFTAQRTRGCLERPLDRPSGSVSDYRSTIWATGLRGY